MDGPNDSDPYLAPWNVFSFITGRKVPPIPVEQRPHTEYNSSWFSRIAWSWLTPLMKTGYLRTLQITDLFEIHDAFRADVTEKKLAQRLHDRWKEQLDRDGGKSKGYWPIILALHDVFWKQFWLAGFFNLISGASGVVLSLLIKYLIQYASNQIDPLVVDKQSVGIGIAYAVLLTLVVILQSLGLNQFEYTSGICGARMRGALVSVMHSKYARLSNQERTTTFSAGKVTNLISIDAHKLDMSVEFIHYTTAFLPVVGGGVIVLMTSMGVSGLSGLGVVVLGIAATLYFAKVNVTLRRKVIQYTDERITTVKEVLESIKLVKFYAWELAYANRIFKSRSREEKHIKAIAASSSFSGALSQTVSYFAGLVTFVVYVKIGSQPSAAKMFSALNIFDVILPYMAMLPRSFTFCGDAMVSLTRINEFLTAADDDSYVVHQPELRDDGIALSIKQASFSWKADGDEKNTAGFRNVNLDIKLGSLAVVAGSVGSGKSSFLAAITGKMVKLGGSVSVVSNPATCVETWNLNATIRDNILFYREYDQEWYDQVVHACCLGRDFEILPHGDQTITGEGGVTLSGGQKARVSLARAVYAKSDVYIFEDVLSAVDPHVAADMIDRCLCGLLKEKTVIIATHQLKLAKLADLVVFMESNGGLISIQSGSLEQLISTSDSAGELMSSASTSDTESDESARADDRKATELDDEANESDPIEDDELIEQEDRAVNAVNAKVYLKYAFAPGKSFYFSLPLLFVLFACHSALQTLISLWVGWWSEDKFSQPSKFYMGIYGGLIGPLFLIQMAGAFLNRFSAVRSNSSIHNKAVERMMRAPLSYFMANPIGRILNRFTRDMDSLDNEISQYTIILFASVGSFFAMFGMVCVFVPYVIPLILPMVFVFCLGTGFYRRSAREVKRLDALLRSVMMTKLNETVNGMPVIMSYGEDCVNSFHSDFNQSIDNMNRAYFLTSANQAWLGFRLDLTGTLVTFIATMLVATNSLKLNGGDVGIVVSMASGMVNTLSYALLGFTNLENCMNSAERLFYYSDEIPQERLVSEEESKQVDKKWPKSGRIEFDNATMKYKPSLPPAMNSITVDIAPGEKVGICGRTGAGKSTILMSVFRMMELCQGSIKIDGVDISQIPLHDLRSRMSIIPQDPVLFQGTIRSNLDPLGEYSDARLHGALAYYDQPSEKSTAQNKFALDYPVEHGGSNFSQGERQLIALARAAIRKSKILVLDEATSNIDYVTDQKIQNIISRQFSESTILCVAHRLRTIINYDKIMVLDSGNLVEFGAPADLYSKDNGVFRDMCNAANIVL